MAKSNRHDEVAKERREVFNAIYGVENINEILELFEADYNISKNKSIHKVTELFKKYSYAIFFLYSPSSIRNNLVKFKNIIRKNGGRYMANCLEAFDIENIYKPIKKDDLETKRELKKDINKNINEIEPSDIINKIKEVKKIIDNKTYIVANNQTDEMVRRYYLFYIIGLATGRRATEILKTLELSKRGQKVFFGGLLKGENKKIEGHIIELSYAELRKYLKELRKIVDTDKLSESAVNKKYSRVFNNAMKRLFNLDNMKHLRHLYSIAGSQLFKKDNESVEDTITRILGHRETFTSALNYTKS